MARTSSLSALLTDESDHLIRAVRPIDREDSGSTAERCRNVGERGISDVLLLAHLVKLKGK